MSFAYVIKRLETEVTTREADMNKREAALHEIDPDVGILFKQCEMVRVCYCLRMSHTILSRTF